MNFFSDFKAINKVVFKKTNQSYIRNLNLIPLLIVYMIAYILINMLLGYTIGQLGNGGSFIIGIMGWFIRCFLISDFLFQVDRTLIGRKFEINQLGHHYMEHFRPLLTATAIPSIIITLLAILTRGLIVISPMFLYLFYILYATPEVIYQKHIDRLEIFYYGHDYLKENWQIWGAINAIFIVLIYGFYQVMVLLINPIWAKLAVHLPNIAAQYLSLLILSIVLSIPFIYYAIYRGFIFKILSVSSRRKREYMRNIYGK